MRHFLYLLAAAIFTPAIHCQIIGVGNCPIYDAMHNFDPVKFNGTWYEAMRSFDVSRVGSKCGVMNVTAANSTALKLHHTSCNFLFNIPFEEDLVAQPEGDVKRGKFRIKRTYFWGWYTYEFPLWILGTDYKNYAVLWSCNTGPFLNFKYAWIYSRVPIPSSRVLDEAFDVLNPLQLDKSFFHKTNQQDC